MKHINKMIFVSGLLLLVGILFVGLVSATPSFTFKQYNTINLKIPCYDSNNSLCAITTVCKISVGNPLQQYIVTGETMASMGNGIYNYSVAGSNLSILGEYPTTVSCTDVYGENGFSSFSFEVTPSGVTKTLGFYFLIIIISAGLIILGFAIKDNWVVVLGGFALVLVGLYTLFYGIDIIKDPTYTWGLGIILLMAGAYFGVRGSFEALVD